MLGIMWPSSQVTENWLGRSGPLGTRAAIAIADQLYGVKKYAGSAFGNLKGVAEEI